MLKKFIIIISSLLAMNTCVAASENTSDAKVSVYKPDGSLQCKKNTGISLVAMENQLINNGVQVFDKRKGSDGKMRIMLCGAKTGRINIFSIQSHDLSKAKKLGFKQK